MDLKKISLLVVDLFTIVTHVLISVKINSFYSALLEHPSYNLLYSGFCFYRGFKVQNNLRSVERGELERKDKTMRPHVNMSIQETIDIMSTCQH